MLASDRGATEQHVDAFRDQLMSMVTDQYAFSPLAYYDSDGDCIEFLTENVSYRADRIDDRLTVYVNRENDEIVGSLIKGVRRLMGEISQECPGFSIEIVDGRVKLSHLFSASLWQSHASSDKVRRVTYQKVRDVADEARVEVVVPAFA